MEINKPFRYLMWRVKRICVFEHSVMTKNFNCACPAIQKGQGSGFLSEGSSSWLPACMSEQRRFWWDCADAQARLTFAARIGDKHQIRLTQPLLYYKILNQNKVALHPYPTLHDYWAMEIDSDSRVLIMNWYNYEFTFKVQPRNECNRRPQGLVMS